MSKRSGLNQPQQCGADLRERQDLVDAKSPTMTCFAKALYICSMKSESSRAAMPQNVKRTSSSKTSKTDWARVRSMKEEDIALT